MASHYYHPDDKPAERRKPQFPMFISEERAEEGLHNQTLFEGIFHKGNHYTCLYVQLNTHTQIRLNTPQQQNRAIDGDLVAVAPSDSGDYGQVVFIKARKNILLKDKNHATFRPINKKLPIFMVPPEIIPPDLTTDPECAQKKKFIGVYKNWMGYFPKPDIKTFYPIEDTEEEEMLDSLLEQLGAPKSDSSDPRFEDADKIEEEKDADTDEEEKDVDWRFEDAADIDPDLLNENYQRYTEKFSFI